MATIYRVPDDENISDNGLGCNCNWPKDDDKVLGNPGGLGDMGYPPAMQVTVHTIPGGEKGTKATLERMKKIVIETIKDPKYGAFFRGLAIKITLDAGCKTKNFQCEAKSLFDFVKTQLKWIRDTKGFETLQYPYRTLAFGGGDCDDLSIVLSTLSISVGIPTKFRAIAADRARPSQFSHVYVVMDPMANGTFIGADPTVKSASFGWESPLRLKVMDLEI